MVVCAIQYEPRRNARSIYYDLPRFAVKPCRHRLCAFKRIVAGFEKESDVGRPVETTRGFDCNDAHDGGFGRDDVALDHVVARAPREARPRHDGAAKNGGQRRLKVLEPIVWRELQRPA
jgi:hypothetical protein